MRYIDADALMEDLRTAKPITETEAVAFRFAYLKVKDAPTVDVQPVKRGKWIRDGHHIRCKNCHTIMCDTDREGDRFPANFCPNCGADMREG